MDFPSSPSPGSPRTASSSRQNRVRGEPDRDDHQQHSAERLASDGIERPTLAGFGIVVAERQPKCEQSEDRIEQALCDDRYPSGAHEGLSFGWQVVDGSDGRGQRGSPEDGPETAAFARGTSGSAMRRRVPGPYPSEHRRTRFEIAGRTRGLLHACRSRRRRLQWAASLVTTGDHTPPQRGLVRFALRCTECHV